MNNSLKKQLRILKVEPRIAWKHATRDFVLLRAQESSPRVLSFYERLQLIFGSIKVSFSILVSQYPSISIPRRMIAVPLSVFLLAVVGLGVTATAARSTVPGDVLYPVKLVTERVQISLTWQGKDRSKLKAEFATRRLDEISTLVKQPNVKKEHVEQAIADFKDKVASAKDDLAQAKEEGNVHDVVEVAKILDSQTQEYEKKLGEVKKDLAPETKQELTATMNAALDAVEEVSANSLTTLVEQADKDGVTKEEVKQIIQNRIDTVVTSTNKEVHTSEPLVSEVELPKVKNSDPKSELPARQADGASEPERSGGISGAASGGSATTINDKILEVRSYLAEDDLTKALGAITETKALVRKQEGEKEVDTSRGSSTSESSQSKGSVPTVPSVPSDKQDDQFIVDKKQESTKSVESAPSALSANNSDAPGAIIIEEK